MFRLGVLFASARRASRMPSIPGSFNIFRTARVSRLTAYTPFLAVAIAILQLTLSSASANTTNENIQRWTGMSLEQLLNEPVVTPSRNPETLASSAAAIQVITSEDIRRSGAITLPEVL